MGVYVYKSTHIDAIKLSLLQSNPKTLSTEKLFEGDASIKKFATRIELLFY
jgi:hypothetical protein